MADNIDIAILDLDEWTDVLSALNRKQALPVKKGVPPAFTNDSVMKLIKGWGKILLWLHPDQTAIHRRAVSNYVLMHRNKTDDRIKGTPSKDLWSTAVAFYDVLDRDKEKQIDGDFFNRASDAMEDFVWDYWSHLSGKDEKDFSHKLNEWGGRRRTTR